jgi:hypothetical protein
MLNIDYYDSLTNISFETQTFEESVFDCFGCMNINSIEQQLDDLIVINALPFCDHKLYETSEFLRCSKEYFSQARKRLEARNHDFNTFRVCFCSEFTLVGVMSDAVIAFLEGYIKQGTPKATMPHKALRGAFRYMLYSIALNRYGSIRTTSTHIFRSRSTISKYTGTFNVHQNPHINAAINAVNERVHNK